MGNSSGNRYDVAERVPELSGKIFLVTGANSGIGYEATKIFASKGAYVVMGCRSIEKATVAKERLESELPNAKVEIMCLDLGDIQSIKSFAKEFSVKFSRLDVLVNNAGVMAVPQRRVTKDGLEVTFGTNVVGSFALTALLFPTLTQSSSARVINVTSEAHRLLTDGIDFENLDGKKSYNKWKKYGESKLGNVAFTMELDSRCKDAGLHVTSLCCHPGASRTNLSREVGWFSFNDIMNNILPKQSAYMGSLPTVMAAVEPTLSGGEYIGPNGCQRLTGWPVVQSPSPRCKDLSLRAKLWKVCEEKSGVNFEI